MSSIEVPIYRAKKIDSDEDVEGALIANAFFKRETKEPCCYIFDNSKMDYDCFVDIGEQLDDYEIDPSTLEISFDNGINWLDVDLVRAYINASIKTLKLVAKK